jgi:hypothetical protein
MGPRTSLDAAEKRKIVCPSHESNPYSSAIQPIAHHYTDWAILTILTHIEKANKIGLSESN